MIPYPADLPYESQLWPNIPVEDQGRITQLKKMIREHNRELYEPHTRMYTFSKEDEKKSYAYLKKFEKELYELESNYGLIEEAKNYVKTYHSSTPIKRVPR